MTTFSLQEWVANLLTYVLALPDVPCTNEDAQWGRDLLAESGLLQQTHLEVFGDDQLRDCQDCEGKGTIPHPLRERLLPLLSVPCDFCYKWSVGCSKCGSTEGTIEQMWRTGRLPRDTSVFLNDEERQGFLDGIYVLALEVHPVSAQSLTLSAQRLTGTIHRLGDQQ